MHNFPNIHNQPLGPNRYLYTVTAFGDNGNVVAGGSIDTIYPIRNCVDYKRMSGKALDKLGLDPGSHTVILNLINNPNWR